MAQILLGPNVAVMSGSIGGTVYARNRYGAYARNRTKPVDPGTNNQTGYRTRVSAAVAAWAALTQAQQLKFNEVAKTTDFVNRIGQSFHPSGINLFVRTYNLLDIAGHTQVTVPPACPIIADGDAYAAVETDVRCYLNSTTSDWPAGAILALWRARDKTAATYFFKGPYEGLILNASGGFVADKTTIWTAADLTTKTCVFAMWRLIGTDGAASHPRRFRLYWETT